MTSCYLWMVCKTYIFLNISQTNAVIKHNTHRDSIKNTFPFDKTYTERLYLSRTTRWIKFTQKYFKTGTSGYNHPGTQFSKRQNLLTKVVSIEFQLTKVPNFHKCLLIGMFQLLKCSGNTRLL